MELALARPWQHEISASTVHTPVAASVLEPLAAHPPSFRGCLWAGLCLPYAGELRTEEQPDEHRGPGRSSSSLTERAAGKWRLEPYHTLLPEAEGQHSFTTFVYSGLQAFALGTPAAWRAPLRPLITPSSEAALS